VQAVTPSELSLNKIQGVFQYGDQISSFCTSLRSKHSLTSFQPSTEQICKDILVLLVGQLPEGIYFVGVSSFETSLHLTR